MRPRTPNRLHVLHLGHIAMPQRWIRSGGPDEYTTIPVLGFLVEGPDDLILVDTGCSPLTVDDPEQAWGPLARLYHPAIDRSELVDAQIRACGFSVEDVTGVVVTHLHMDHAGGLQLLPRPRVWMQRAEHRWGLAPDPSGSGGYYRQEYDLEGIRPQLLDGDADVAPGVRCFLTAGHTPGHQSVLVELEHQTVCIMGDAAYNRKNLDRRTNPALAWDTSLYMAGLGHLATVEEFFGATLLFSHDPDQAAALAQGPNPLT